MDLRIADDAAPRHLLAAGLELRLDEHERLPARLRERRARRQRDPDADERDVADDEIAARTAAPSSSRAFVRSSTVTRGSLRSLGCSWP